MRAWKCDKCGTEIGEGNTYHPYSSSKGKEVDLCLRCLKDYDKHMKEADKAFWNKKGGKK